MVFMYISPPPSMKRLRTTRSSHTLEVTELFLVLCVGFAGLVVSRSQRWGLGPVTLDSEEYVDGNDFEV